MQQFSDFMVYVDESGDHSLTSIDKNYPIFVLAFCVFYKKHYLTQVVTKVQKLKFDTFGHDFVILHEHEIRKEKGEFNIFKSFEEKQAFLENLNLIMKESNFILIAHVIEKHKIKAEQIKELHAYHYSLKHCLETLYELMIEKSQQDKITFVAVESRGAKEDTELELEFLRICNGENRFNKVLPFKVKVVSKMTNSVGLQLVDLVARPIGRYVLQPTQPNRALDILKAKFYCKGGRKQVGMDFDQVGLRHFP
ncbi:MAG: DUF3800 domain-containing protein [Moraxella sp.]|jgi:hypothetical protein